MNTPKPYVYQGVHPTTKEIYFGSRTANKIAAMEDLIRYRTSSKIVKPRFDEFMWSIVQEFDTKEAAYDFEQILIFERWGDPLLLNRTVNVGGERRFSRIGVKHTDETRAKMSKTRTGKTNGHLGLKRSTATREAMKGSSRKGIKLSSDVLQRRADNPLSGMKGKVQSEETKAKISLARKIRTSR